MPFVQRDGSGNIIALFETPQRGIAREQISGSDPAVAAFVNRPKPADPWIAFVDAVDAASTLAQLKEVLLGRTGPVRIAIRGNE